MSDAAAAAARGRRRERGPPAHAHGPALRRGTCRRPRRVVPGVDLDRRAFLGLGLAAFPALAGVRLARPGALALATADTEAQVVEVALDSGRVTRRLATVEDPRSIESGDGGHVVVAHPAAGAVSLLTVRPARVQRVLRGLGAPRYTAIAPGGAHAFVTDGERGEVFVVDLRRGRIVGGVEVGAGARHVTLDPAGRTLWAALGSSASAIAVVDVSDPARPRLRRRVAPPFLAHDVAFSPTGRRVWVTAGRERRLAILPAAGAGRAVLLAADDAPQHVSFGHGVAFVASGNGASVRAHDLADGRMRHVARVPYGSYNVQAGAGAVVTPSLLRGTLTVLDRAGRVLREVKVASAAHDACIVR
jgi:DNA-binding beta-propeller fold protein YncE